MAHKGPGLFLRRNPLRQRFDFQRDQSLDDFGRHGTIGTAWAFLWMPEMLPFRQDPRFQALCSRMRLFDYWNKYGPPDNHELRDGKLICH